MKKSPNKLFKLISCIVVLSLTLTSIPPYTFSQTTPDPHPESNCWNGSEQDNGTSKDPNSPEKDKDQEKKADPVNLATGAYQYQHEDLFIPGRGIAFELTRFYDSKSLIHGPFGIGWTHNYNIYLMEATDGSSDYVLRKNPDDTIDKFTLNPDGSYQPPENCYDTLVKYETFPQELAQVLPTGVTSGYLIKDKHAKGYIFDSNGKLIVIFDRNFNKLIFQYDSQNRLSQVTDTLNRVITFSYNSQNKINTITDFAGKVFTYDYDASSNLISMATPLSTVTNYGYDNQHQLISIADPKGNIYLANTYDQYNRVIEQQYGAGKFFLTYSAGLTTILDRKNNKTDYYLNSDGTTAKEVKYSSTGSFTTLYQYNSHKEITKTTYPKNNFLVNTYDDKGNLLEIRRQSPPDFPDPDIVTGFTYEPRFNFVKTATDPKGNVTTYYYDYEESTLGDLNGDGITTQSNGNLVKVVYPLPAAGSLQPVALSTYNNFGQLQTQINPLGVVTKYEYDPATGQVSRIVTDYGTGHINASTQFTYDQLGNVISVLDPENHTTSFTYNSLNQLVESIVHGPQSIDIKTKYTYDKNGNLIKLERQANDSATQWQTTEYEYDIIDQLIQVTSRKLQAPSPEDQITQYQYDANGNRSQIIDAENHSTYYYYDEKDLLYKTIDALGSVTEYTYDPNNNLSRIKDANNNITQYFYDGFDRLIKTVYPDNSYEQYTYDNNSNLVAKRNRKGQLIDYAYDGLNRLTTKTCIGFSTTSYAYDLASRLTQVTGPNSTIDYSYDNLNRVLSSTYHLPLTAYNLAYEYDKSGNRTKLTYPDGDYIDYVYDNLNRLSQINDSGGGAIASYSYDVLSRRTNLSYANGASAAYSYDSLNRLTGITGSTGSTFSYTYDKVGNRLSKTTAAGQENYTYDNIYQLTSVINPLTSENYTYDKLGNRITKTSGGAAENYVSNNLNQYTSVDSNNLTYDLNGNLINDGTRTLGYDFENRLVGVTDGMMTASYSYGPFGRRISKTVGGVTTNFVYDGDQIIGEYDGSTGALLRKYVYGPGIDEPVLLNDGTNKYYYHFDGLGSVAELTDSSGAVKEKYEYSAYGNTVIKNPANEILPQSAIGNRFGFTGRELDNETSLYHYRARAYSSELGKFLSIDPWSYVDGMNLYRYVQNNPINWLDSFGLETEVLYEHPIKGNPNRFGHSAVRVDNKVYEVQKVKDRNGKTNYEIRERNYEDVLKDNRPEDKFKVPLPPDKEAQLKKDLEKQLGKDYDYDYMYNNCADFVENALRRADVDLPIDIIETPENTLKQVKDYANQYQKEKVKKPKCKK